ncbi:hypothetical protein GOD90_10705 [Sinorhizobium medicae]|nr:hypothetical protein [Sinorhizobium medicae]
MNHLYFAVEGGRTLELARTYVAERSSVEKRNRETAVELGAERYVVSILDGTLSGVEFDGNAHPDFKKPDRRGVSFPKKGSEWAAKLAAAKGYDRRGYRLAEALGVPTTIDYTTESGYGSSVISRSFNSGVGLLYLSEIGPFALYIPDIAEVVARYEAEGRSVCGECKNFKPSFDGARPILKEEWELVIAQYEVEEAKKRIAA